MAAPGVYVTTSARSGVAGQVTAPSGQFFIVGMFERGPIDRAVQVRNIGELERVFGTRTPYSSSYDQLVTFFSEGGRQAQVVRVVGAGATAGTLTLKDRAATPADTLQFDAASVGNSSTTLSVEVLDGSVANTFRVRVYQANKVVEDYNNLANPVDAVSRFSNSVYVRVTNLASTSASPTNNPAAIERTALSAGDDARMSVTADTYIAGLDLFTETLGTGAVAIPGQGTSAAHAGLVAHAERFNRVALLAAPMESTVSSLQALSSAVDSEYAGLFAPWVNVPVGAGMITPLSPEGYVAAVRARAHETVGPWRKPAGNIARAQHVLSLVTVFDNDDAELLAESKVSPIRGEGVNIRLYGWNSLSTDRDNWRDLKDRDLVNWLVTESTRRLENYVFETIDNRGQLMSQIEAELVGLVDPVAQANGLYARFDDEGNEIDPGYAIDTRSLNTESTIVNNELHVGLAVRVSTTSDLINLTIVKAGIQSAL